MPNSHQQQTTNHKPQTKNWFASWFDTPYYHILYKERNYREAQVFMDKSKSAGFVLWQRTSRYLFKPARF